MASAWFGKGTSIGFALSPRRNPGLSVFRTALLKSAIAIRSALYLRRFGPTQQRKLDQLKEMKGRFFAAQALVVAGGPSVSNIDPHEISELQKSGRLDVFAINNFFNSSIGSELNPDFFVLTDPGGGSHDPFYAAGEILRKYPNATLFLPVHWDIEHNLLPELAERVVCFENRSLEGFGREAGPLRLRRYISLTALSAMSIAAFMGYRRVGIIGLDATTTFRMKVDKKNRIFLPPNHHPGAAPPDSALVTRRKQEDGLYEGTVRNASDLFFAEATLHDHLDRFFAPDGRFVNLSDTSVITSFPREAPSTFMAKLRSNE